MIKRARRIFSNFWYQLRHGIPYGVSQLFYYGPTVWHDHDFDANGLLCLMRKKLMQLEPIIRDGNHVKRERDADDIHRVVLALERLLMNNYFREEEEVVNKKWGKSKTVYQPTSNPMLKKLIFTRPKCNTDEEKEQVHLEMEEVCERARAREKEDKRIVFDTIRDRYGHWWD